MKKIRVLSLFSGIGAFERGLQDVGVDYELVNYCEINNHASKCYSLIHNEPESKNLCDVTKVNTETLQNINLITHGSPCQDFSTAGLQRGGEEGSGTRSSLLWETVRIVRDTLPQYVIWENVKNATQGKHKEVFDKYLDSLCELGYSNYVPVKFVLNAKDYEIPQSRERVFVVSIRKDIDDGSFKFPQAVPLECGVEDFIDFREKDDITASFFNRYKDKFGEDRTIEEFNTYIDGLPIKKGIGTKAMNLYDFNEMDTITMPTGLTGTLTCRNVQNHNKKFWYDKKLYRPSPRMCFKLMGFTDDDFEKVKDIGKDSELWDRAGNSIVTTIPKHIFKELLKEYIVKN